MTETKKVRVVRGTHRCEETNEVVGPVCSDDVGHVPVSTIEQNPGRFEAVSGVLDAKSSSADSTADSDDDDEPDATDEPLDVSEFLDRPWNAIKKDIESGAYDGDLDQILAVEADNRERKSVIEALEERSGD